jgi:hypothetical protein
MKKFVLSDRDIDRLLSGGRPADGDEEPLAAFLGSARRVLSTPPDEATERAHLAAMLSAARPRPVATILPSSSTRREARESLGLRLRAAAAKVAIGALGLTTTTAGLAMAGVDLPGTLAEKAFSRVGISLPNQGGDPGDQDDLGASNASETSDRVHEAIRNRDDSMSGCEFGASVSRAARGVSDEGDPEHCNRDKPDKNDRSGRGPKEQPPGQAKDHPGGKGSNNGNGTEGTPSGLDETTKKGKPATPAGVDNKEAKAATPPDPQSGGNGGANPGTGSTSTGP